MTDPIRADPGRRTRRPPAPATTRPPTLAELVATLSLATDLGMAQPWEAGLGTALVASELSRRLGLDRATAHRVYYLALLQHIGCTATSHEESRVLGDELALRPALVAADPTDPTSALRLAAAMQRLPGLSAAEAARRLGAAAPNFGPWRDAVCEVARMLGARLGFGPETLLELDAIYERWDGAGHPGGLAGESLPVAVRVVHVANAVRIAADEGGLASVRTTLAGRAGGWYDPDIATAASDHADELVRLLDTPSRWEAALAAEPGGPTALSDARLDDMLRAMAEFLDLKSPILAGHSAGVARLAAAAADARGLSAGETTGARQAGWVHDLGRVAVSAATWEKPSHLTSAEWEQVRLHAYHADRILARLPRSGPAHPFVIASMHHERQDGSGYFRSAVAAALPAAARILAAADAYQAMREERPYRRALDRAAAAAEMGREVRAGRLDAGAVDAVLAAAGERRPRRASNVAGLTEREVEVLQLLARGQSIAEIAAALVISPKTAGKHVENIYGKTSVTSRAAVTLFAMRNDLLR